MMAQRITRCSSSSLMHRNFGSFGRSQRAHRWSHGGHHRRFFAELALPEAIRSSADMDRHSLMMHERPNFILKSRRCVERKERLRRNLRDHLIYCTVELRSLPCGLREKHNIDDAIQFYSSSNSKLNSYLSSDTVEYDDVITGVIQNCLEQDGKVVRSIMLAIRRFMDETGNSYEAVQPCVDTVLRRFFMARIGLRFHLRHYIEGVRPSHYIVSPGMLLHAAARDTGDMCMSQLRRVPKMRVHEESPGTIEVAPVALRYILVEVLKNACCAVIERHAGGGLKVPLPPVHCYIEYSDQEVVIKIKDEGGGITDEQMDKIWQFMYTTAGTSSWCAGVGKFMNKPPLVSAASQRQHSPNANGSSKSRNSPPVGALSGYGVGLVMSRLYAQYFGGDLTLSSVPGVGTEVCIRLLRSNPRLE